MARQLDAGVLRRVMASAMLAIRANLLPGILLWAVGLLVIGSYYWWAPVQSWLSRLAEFRAAGGFVFSAVSTAIFGGLLPAILRPDGKRELASGSESAWIHAWPIYTFSNCLFWSAKGIEIDLLYRLQASLFGESPGWLLVAVKTGIDQFIYCPIWGVTNVVLFYRWREAGYPWSFFAEIRRPGWYAQCVLPVLIPNWFVWIPAVFLIYCLPLELQLPIQNLVLCAWVLLLHFFAAPSRTSD